MLHITQPTLSGQVKELEERYGTKLFLRHGRRIELTDIGKSAFSITRHLFRHEEEVEAPAPELQRIADEALKRSIVEGAAKGAPDLFVVGLGADLQIALGDGVDHQLFMDFNLGEENLVMESKSDDLQLCLHGPNVTKCEL